MWEVTVDKDKCDGDEECVDVCPVDVFEMVDGKADPVNAEECLGCESCVEVCEAEAITVEEVQQFQRKVFRILIEDKKPEFLRGSSGFFEHSAINKVSKIY